MKLYIIILKGVMNRKMKGIKVKDLKIECGTMSRKRTHKIDKF